MNMCLLSPDWRCDPFTKAGPFDMSRTARLELRTLELATRLGSLKKNVQRSLWGWIEGGGGRGLVLKGEPSSQAL